MTVTTRRVCRECGHSIVVLVRAKQVMCIRRKHHALGSGPVEMTPNAGRADQ